MHRYMVSKHTPNLAQIGRAILSYSLAANFGTPHAARATYQGEPRNEPIPTVIRSPNGPIPL